MRVSLISILWFQFPMDFEALLVAKDPPPESHDDQRAAISHRSIQ